MTRDEQYEAFQRTRDEQRKRGEEIPQTAEGYLWDLYGGFRRAFGMDPEQAYRQALQTARAAFPGARLP